MTQHLSEPLLSITHALQYEQRRRTRLLTSLHLPAALREAQLEIERSFGTTLSEPNKQKIRSL
jgi:hypothetical protein